MIESVTLNRTQASGVEIVEIDRSIGEETTYLLRSIVTLSMFYEGPSYPRFGTAVDRQNPLFAQPGDSYPERILIFPRSPCGPEGV